MRGEEEGPVRTLEVGVEVEEEDEDVPAILTTKEEQYTPQQCPHWRVQH
jgi:hypothetical protein